MRSRVSPLCRSTPWASMPTTRVFSRTSTPSRPSERRAAARRSVAEARKNRRPRLHHHDARARGVDGLELVAKRLPRDLGQRPREFDAGGPAADEHEGEQLASPCRILLAFGALERHQDAPSHQQGVVERLEPGRERFPFGMAEVRMARRRWRRSGSRSRARRRRGARPGARSRPPTRPRRAGRGRCRPCAGPTGSARRCRRRTAWRWPPGTAAAGRGGSCGDRPASRAPAHGPAPWQRRDRQNHHR